MHGYGEFNWKDGKKYVGFYKQDKKEGFGIYYWEDPNKIYIGFWNNGKQDGVGKYITKDKICYGLWNSGERVRWLKDVEEVKGLMDNEQLKFSYLFKYDLLKIKKFLSQS